MGFTINFSKVWRAIWRFLGSFSSKISWMRGSKKVFSSWMSAWSELEYSLVINYRKSNQQRICVILEHLNMDYLRNCLKSKELILKKSRFQLKKAYLLLRISSDMDLMPCKQKLNQKTNFYLCFQILSSLATIEEFTK